MYVRSKARKRETLAISVLSLTLLTVGCNAPPVRPDDSKKALQTAEDKNSEEREPIEIDPRILEPLEKERLGGKRIVFIEAVTVDGEEVIFYPKGVETKLRDSRLRDPVNSPTVQLFEITSEARILFRENPCCHGRVGGSLYKKWRSYCYPTEWIGGETMAQCR